MKRILITLLSVHMAIGIAYAQPDQKDSLQSFSLASLETGKIDPQFNGVSPSALVNALKDIASIKKGEFESTPEFNQRKNNLLSKKIIGNSKIESLFPFVVKVGKYSPCLNGIMYGYDADGARASLYLSAEPEALGGPDYRYSSYGDSPKFDTFELARDYQKDRSYTASNSFGSKITVVETKGIIYEVASKKISYIKGPRTLSCVEKKPMFTLKMDSSTAAKELPSLKALIILKLNSPYVLYSYHHHEATLNSPNETKVQTKAILGGCREDYRLLRNYRANNFSIPKKISLRQAFTTTP